ncbi:unnamed protein product [Closterium sp. Yama58-4]|nr:unnamed protein product [Closterium sp. Yama58-4]
MDDGMPWPGSRARDHPAMVQVFLGPSSGDGGGAGAAVGAALGESRKGTEGCGEKGPGAAGNGTKNKTEKAAEEGSQKGDSKPKGVTTEAKEPASGTGIAEEEGVDLPRLVYVEREKRPGYNEHGTAGALNALLRVSALLSNAPFLLTLDANHYVNNAAALREAMCFLMDGSGSRGADVGGGGGNGGGMGEGVGNNCCFVQFPLRFDGVDESDRYDNHNTVFYDLQTPALDGIQGPMLVGSGCCFRRQALYGVLYLLALLAVVMGTSVLEAQWGGVTLTDLWRAEQLWVVSGVSAHLFAVVQGVLKVVAGIDTSIAVKENPSSAAAGAGSAGSAGAGDDKDGEHSDLYTFKWTALLLPPALVVGFNTAGIIVGIAQGLNGGITAWKMMLIRVAFALWVIMHLHPFIKGFFGKERRLPPLVLIWGVLLSSVLTLLWVNIDPFGYHFKGPDPVLCGIRC